MLVSIEKLWYDAFITTGENIMKKKPYYRVKYAELKSISDKAWIVRCYDGSQDMLPKSQCLQSIDSLLVPAWLAEKKSIQYSNKKVWR